MTLKTLLAKASPVRSGDELAGVTASSAEERVKAQMELADTPLKRFLNESVIPYESDDVTRLILDSHVPEAFSPISTMKHSRRLRPASPRKCSRQFRKSCAYRTWSQFRLNAM
jgi:ethanolamine ammonia-lyase large subunit